MLRLSLLYIVFIAIFFFCFWLVLGNEFIEKIYLIVIVSLFLSMSFLYISYELSIYRIKKIKELLIKKDKKLKKQSAKLRLRNLQLENLLSGMSHEFKNPLAVIQMSAQTILEDKNMSEEFKLKFINKIISNSNKLNNIINRLRIGFGGDITPNLTTFDAKVLCKEVVANLDQKYKNKIISISGEKILKADYDMIYQVVLNLCENALKYSNQNVQILLNENGVFITDNGEGIDENELRLIQKKFYKSKEYDWNNSLGLGLYIVKFILKLHCFEFVIRSTKGVGSTFGFKDRPAPGFRLKDLNQENTNEAEFGKGQI
ncbi:sensor histidine kinase [Campylobacter hyointestinalis]|uniref:sensor histidine kinase n=2 Tax=Campylobacter hyointestinalis TaxID=198 RepID=UPI00072C304C|nr:HAMP domain-containing sensor histidine kinase [Campylobacter hyointestinalis]PPB54035.1 sensor histidine kinase [Campylobacter hyointestinalis subsp. hyointestinalis]PPB55647.1 sensor histidine kinase [Campylobacter hyointestinalis subsp. hyointestinalis]PPB67136.1 sensor histidine kinase [Campylobacter hyointestinalis subsp. hyointestinalis]PPB70361.1 sensor histidine kinase [Campylobacter hyointestinalis subsp. hyointestinalis]CUU74924.1 sensory trasnduction histidine kinase [Campylobact